MHVRFKQFAPEMLPIPAGRFQMGSTIAQVEAAAVQFNQPNDVFLDELPQHEVSLEAFAISRAPVTCANYLAFVVATDHPTPTYWNNADPPAELLDHPVVEITFNDARAYCRWLSTATGESFRLPTEAEWERAARGEEQRIFPWGNAWDPSYCNTAEANRGATSPVGHYPVDTSPFGCVDIAGNVSEWVNSRYGPYPGGSLALPSQRQVVLRGSAWNNSAFLARVAQRQGADPAAANGACGFRVVRVDE